MGKDNRTTLFVYSYDEKNRSREEAKYVLRIVGLVTDEDVAKMRKDNSVLRSVYTSETVKLSDISMNDNIEGLRLAGVIYYKNDVFQSSKKLLITEKLDFICQTDIKEKRGDRTNLMINGSNGSFIIAEEHAPEKQLPNNISA